MPEFMEGVKDCTHRWSGIQMTEPGQLNLPPTPFDQCGICDVKVWGGAIDAPPTKGFGNLFGDQGSDG
ncbi:MAG: hypothetical protein DLM66_00085 [Candidatus Dormiibacter spiritus]|nr:MAG: hypothetical protein DLM66_00085 [Candidatus Dormibacteraeota bacterium]